MLKTLLIFTASFLFHQAQAAISACPTADIFDLSPACRAEVLNAIQNEKTSKAIRTELEKNLDLKNCRFLDAERMQWKYNPPEAIGPHLEVSSFVVCDGEGYDGYWLGGNYHLDESAPSFEFISIKVSTYE